jgi:curli production assembly/transport component CsgG
MEKFYFPLGAISLLLLCSCGAYYNQPLARTDARIGETTSFTNKLENLPLPEEPVVVGVYSFKDQTGQYKNLEVGSSFSTAVTQGATSILLQALEDSKWFTPIERENLSNLLNERNIIRSTRQEYINNANQTGTQIPPLLYAGVLLEGGIISYNTNIITGGFGARYFGVGGSTQYRQDRITIYLRAISTSSGKILNSVYTSKTILSQAVDVGLFRYVNFQRLLEVETGYTTNEPVQMAVKGAIEKAVLALVIEGIESGLWDAKNETEGQQLVAEYKELKKEEQLTKLYDREHYDRDYKNSINFSLGANRLISDYSQREFGLMGMLAYSRKINPYFALNLEGSAMQFQWADTNNIMGYGRASAEITFLPHDRLTPYVYGGPGMLVDVTKSLDIENLFFQVHYGLGLKYRLSPKLDLKLFAEQNLTFSDEIDFTINGRRDDYYFNFGIGIDYNFGKEGGKNKKSIPEEENEVMPTG